MHLFNDLKEWGVAVFEHWHGWVSGSLLAFAFELGDKIWDWKPNRKIILSFVLAGLIWSIFSAWRDERRHAEEYKTKLDDIDAPGKFPLVRIQFQRFKYEHSKKVDIQLGLVLKNIGTPLLRYRVRSLHAIVDGKEASNPIMASTGGYAYPPQ